MPYNQSCIVILKPTPFFLSFVTKQLADFDQDKAFKPVAHHTAYSIASEDCDENLLKNMARLYPHMFRHEVTRFLGKLLAAKISADFLDFLCCFKFEVYSGALLGEFAG